MKTRSAVLAACAATYLALLVASVSMGRSAAPPSARATTVFTVAQVAVVAAVALAAFATSWARRSREPASPAVNAQLLALVAFFQASLVVQRDAFAGALARVPLFGGILSVEVVFVGLSLVIIWQALRLRDRARAEDRM